MGKRARPGMRHIWGIVGIALVFLSVFGCHKPVVREKGLPDPLLTSKKPIVGKPHLESAPEITEKIPPPPPPPAMKGTLSMKQEVPLVQLLGGAGR
jgi:hypothetical protein